MAPAARSGARRSRRPICVVGRPAAAFPRNSLWLPGPADIRRARWRDAGRAATSLAAGTRGAGASVKLANVSGARRALAAPGRALGANYRAAGRAGAREWRRFGPLAGRQSAATGSPNLY